MNKKILGIFIICLLGLQSLLAQHSLQEALMRSGFENVHLIEQEGIFLIQYEHRNFRDPYASLEWVKRLTREAGIADSLVRFAPLLLGESMGLLDADMRWQVPSSATASQLRQAWSAEQYRFSFRIMPDVNIRFGNFTQPIQEKVGVLLDTRVYLTPGLSVHGGVYIPVSNRLDRTSEKPRVGPAHLNYFKQVKPGHFLMLQTGLFVYDRYGWDLQYRYAPWGKKVSAGLHLNRTGYYAFFRERFFTQPIQEWMLLGDIEYRLPWEGLSIKALGGQFLAGDRGIRMELIRQYGSWDLGFFATVTDIGNTAGFQLAFPLFPGKLLRTRRLELRTTEEFRWEYSVNAEAPVGRRYRTGTPRLEDMLRQFGR